MSDFVKEGPEEAAARLLLAIFDAGREFDAVVFADEVAAGIPDLDERAAWWFALGLEMEARGRFVFAVGFYSEGIELDPVQEDLAYFLFNNCGYSLNQCGCHDKAEERCRRAIEINPMRHNAWKNLGAALEGQELYPEAAKAYVMSARVGANDPQPLKLLDALLAAHGDGVRAVDPDIDLKADELRDGTWSLKAGRGGGQRRPEAEPTR